MRHPLCILVLAALIAVASHARAQDDPAVTGVSGLDVVIKRQVTPLAGLEVLAAPRSTKVEGLDVVAPRSCPPPHSPADQDAPVPELVSTYPGDGQTVQPGFAVLRVTFDLPMACKGSLPQALLAACYGDGIETWHESVDKHSLLILCDLKPGVRYELSINRRIPEHFRSLGGREPKAHQIAFHTSDDPPVTTEEALVGRDPQLVALLKAAGPGRPNAPGAVAAAADQDLTTQVFGVRVRPAKDCLPPRDPPDKTIPTPKLVSTFPTKGQTVRPGLLEVRFTFDLPMACRFGVTTVSPSDDDPCSDGLTEHWFQMWDRRTMRILCRVEPGKHYVMRINDKAGWDEFQGLGGAKAEPYALTFETSNAAQIETQEEADDEDPLMSALVNGAEADREP